MPEYPDVSHQLQGDTPIDTIDACRKILARTPVFMANVEWKLKGVIQVTLLSYTP